MVIFKYLIKSREIGYWPSIGSNENAGRFVVLITNVVWMLVNSFELILAVKVGPMLRTNVWAILEALFGKELCANTNKYIP